MMSSNMSNYFVHGRYFEAISSYYDNYVLKFDEKRIAISRYEFLFTKFSEEMHKFIAEQLQTGRVPLCINPQSAAFKSFAR